MVRRVVVAGYARLPGGISARSLYEYLTLGAIVAQESNTILQGTSTLTTKTGRHWVEENMFGVDLFETPSSFVTAVERDYWGAAGPAIIAAYRDMVSRYQKRLYEEHRH